MSKVAITVTQLSNYLSRIVSTDPILNDLKLKGEVYDLKYHSTGNIYFSLIDKENRIRCLIPAAQGKQLRFELTEGLNIITYGRLNIYQKGSSYTLIISDVEVEGAGELLKAFEQLKNRLLKEGIFDSEHKLKIPKYPKCIGIVTSETGAALQDILKTIKQKNDYTNILIFPVIVQGTDAANSIAQMLDYINREYIDEVETLIIGRGGGSSEDLWAFNEEKVARSIYNSKIPIISAVGHEVDVTISDFVADVRAATPTAAAEIVTFDSYSLRDDLQSLKEELLIGLEGKTQYYYMEIKNKILTIENELKQIVLQNTHYLENLKILVEENNPYKQLEKGYAVICDSNKNIISSINLINDKQPYHIKMKDGEAVVTIKKEG